MNGLAAEAKALADAIVAGCAACRPMRRRCWCARRRPLMLIVGCVPQGQRRWRSAARIAARQAPGAHTGDIAATMLADAGLPLRDRRPFRAARRPQRDRRLVRAKAEAAHGAGLIAIVCVGETQARARRRPHARGRRPQVPARCPRARPPRTWSSPTSRSGRSAPAGRRRRPQVAEMHARHPRASCADRVGRRRGHVRILYGGSVKADECARSCWRSPMSTARWSAAPA